MCTSIVVGIWRNQLKFTRFLFCYTIVMVFSSYFEVFIRHLFKIGVNMLCKSLSASLLWLACHRSLITWQAVPYTFLFPHSLRSWWFLLVGLPESRANTSSEAAVKWGESNSSLWQSHSLAQLSPHFPTSPLVLAQLSCPPTKTASYAGYFPHIITITPCHTMCRILYMHLSSVYFMGVTH